MKHLLFLRHARAGEAPDDHGRPLDARGLGELREVAPALERLAAAGFAPSLVLCSTALRAQQTLDAVSPHLPAAPRELRPELYLATAGELLGVLQDGPDHAQGVLVVGHEPGLSGLARLLTGRPLQLRTGSWAALRAGVGSWRELSPGCAELTAVGGPAR